MTAHLVSWDDEPALYAVCSGLPERETALWRLEQERAGRTVTEHDTAAGVRALVRVLGTAYTRWERERRAAADADHGPLFGGG